MTIEQEIETYLRNNGLSPIPSKELDVQMAELVKRNKKVYKAFQKIARNTTDTAALLSMLNDHHLFYELFQSEENRFTQRIEYLKFLSGYMDTLPASGLKVMEAGCATGLDIGFIAGKHPEHEYKGFDIDNGKIHQAKVRMKKEGLTNVICTPGDYYKPKDDDLDAFDLIYTNSPLRGNLDKTMIIELADKMRPRTKIGGVCLLGGFTRVPVDQIEKTGLEYIKDEVCYTINAERRGAKRDIPFKAYFFERIN